MSADDPGASDARLAREETHWKVQDITLSKTCFGPKLALMVQNRRKQLVAQPFRIVSTQSQRGGKDPGLVLALRMTRAQAVIAKLDQIDECLLAMRELHFLRVPGHF